MSVVFSFLGCGNMGGALVRAAVKSVGSSSVLLHDMDAEKTKKLADEVGAAVCDKAEAVLRADYLFLGVKPQGMALLMEEIRPILEKRNPKPVLVTMAAGMTMDQILNLAGNGPIIRIMPNLAVAAGEGAILYCSKGVSGEELRTFLDGMKCSGKFYPLDEAKMDAASAVSGCGPGFMCYFIEALVKGGKDCGLPEDLSESLAVQTMLGTAKLLRETGRSAENLRIAVCSPGGTTLAGLSSMDEHSFTEAAASAIVGACRRSEELRKQS